ncbi:MAG: malto-oligosyltrehalose synthase, partial [Candidatus Thiodiazotropha sp.]
MSGQTPLDRLCERYGISLDYRDIWGQRHAVGEQTRRRLLAAMGIEAGNDPSARQALSDSEDAEWRRYLPPAQVAWKGTDSLDIPLYLPDDRIKSRYRWTLQQENGERQAGEFQPIELEPTGKRMIHGIQWHRRLLRLAEPPDHGYHRLELHNLDQPQDPIPVMSLIVAPPTCYQPQAIEENRRVWGPAIQLYTLRSARNWGIGDFTDLRHVLEFAAEAGAALVGLNPLHALFPHDPDHACPYNPSSRLFLNILYVDVEAVEDFAECEAAGKKVADELFQARLRALRASEQVDYPEVAKAKLEILTTLFHHFRHHHLNSDSERAQAFHRFQSEQGEPLRQHALHETLQGWLHEQDSASWGWPTWPEAYRDPQSKAVAAFAAEQAPRVEFFEYLQWQAHLQLEAAGRHSFELGLGVGLYLDLAVGADIGGSEVWSDPSLYALSAHMGSPADDFNLHGQDWGLPPWHPQSLRQRAYLPFIELLRRNMQNAGALRIDHVMSLMRLFWAIPGSAPITGSYVAYPFHDLLGILALESQRNRCLVIGEDLGTVPREVRDALRPLGVLSYRLFYFEKVEAGGFKPPADFEPQALVSTSTHDLPTLAGYWLGRDLELRTQLALFPSRKIRERQVIDRAEDRARLLMALEREGLLPAGMSVQPVAVPALTPELIEAIHVYLARTPGRVMMAQLEDILGQTEQVNLPGTTHQYPNWRLKLSLDLELWSDDPRIKSLTDALKQERPCLAGPPAPIPLVKSTARAQIPSASYRLQLHRGFSFADAKELVPYLHQLGITHCYVSPCLQARSGSPHGYDIIDHGVLNEELGGEAGFDRFAAALRDRGMGLIMDMVPNHMGVMGSDNTWWLDVLENGPASLHARDFDIDWTSRAEPQLGKLLVPVLGDHYGSVLERGELKLRFDPAGGAFSIRYFDHLFPIDPAEYPRILGHDIARLEERLGGDSPQLMKFQSLITRFDNLPRRSESDPGSVAERNRDKEVHKAALSQLYRDADIARYLDENLRTFNDSSHFELLHELLENQAWRLTHWRVGSDEINYRRFFDINELAGLRMEIPEVFEATHKLILELIAKGQIQGLRVDHPDGLYDPARYFKRLQARVAMPQSAPIRGANPALPDKDNAQIPMPLYLLVEKILAGHERLRRSWAVHGTTGYDFANIVNGLFVDSDAEKTMTNIYRAFTGETLTLEVQVYNSKKLIMRSTLASELNVLAQQLNRIAKLDPHTRDFTLNSLRDTLSEVVACFPVYRTYVTRDGADEEDRRYVDWAVSVARKRSRTADPTVFDFVREVLLTEIAEGKSDDYRCQVSAFAMKFQQYTGPVMAKGLEDTAFYHYNRLISLNEVGGEPERFGISVNAFHHLNLERIHNWPHAMLCTSTHDSKRGEDVRARIDVLTELPGEWEKRVRSWARLNRGRKCLVDDRPAPSRNDEYHLYQTLVGSWPLELLDEASLDETRLAGFQARIQAYLLKAVREAKAHTSWINPDKGYEKAVTEFIAALLDSPQKNPFITDLLEFLSRIHRAGLCNGLAQTLFKFTAPGMPDLYQGNELWTFSLVDPDNRRPVDYARRQGLLAQLQAAVESTEPLSDLVRQLADNLEDGRAKLYLTWRCLTLRSEYRKLFDEGDYLPLQAKGPCAQHLCAFARRQGGQFAVAIAPRLTYRLTAGAPPLGEAVWEETRIELPLETWHNRLSGESLHAEFIEGAWYLAAGDLLRYFPVTLLYA